jgi:hypothetical protein
MSTFFKNRRPWYGFCYNSECTVQQRSIFDSHQLFLAEHVALAALLDRWYHVEIWMAMAASAFGRFRHI